MLDTLQALASQGYSRSGAVASENGYNFEGGDLLLASNWHAYKNSRNNLLPSGKIPGIVAEDGTAAGDLFNMTLVHRSGMLSYRPGGTGALRNTLYELDGGTLRSAAALRLQDARMVTYRGLADIGNQPIEMNRGSAVLEISGGTMLASALSVAEAATATDGFKIVRFKGGAGSLELGATDPIGFGDDGSPDNDFIDFVTGARGRLVTTREAAYFASLWDDGRLRIDGEAGAMGQFANSGFELIGLGDGRNALVLNNEQRLTFDFDAKPSRIYAVDHAEELQASGTWETVELVSGSTGLQTFTYPFIGEHRFYRIKVFVP
jgi:hypothetical protein